MRKLIALALLALASLAAFANRGNGGAVRGAAARAGMMAAVYRPYEAEVSYLTCSGTQTIQTDFYPDNYTCVEVSCKYPSGSPTGMMRLFYSANFRFDFYTAWSWKYAYSVGSGDNETSWAGTSIKTMVVKLDGKNQLITMNGSSVAASVSATYHKSSTPLFFFSKSKESGTFFNGTFYYAKIYDNGTLVRDFIPVRVGSVGYMYDRVSGILFGNSGTGAFIVGPDK